MIQVVLQSPKIITLLYKVPILKYFFVLHINQLRKLTNANVLALQYELLYVSDGTSKQTLAERFKDLEQATLQYLTKDKINVIHDVAVSSGVSSVKFYELVRNNHFNTDFYVSDKYAKVWISKDKTQKVYDAEGKLMLAYVGKFLATDKIVYFPLSKRLFSYIQKQSIGQEFNSSSCNHIKLYDNKVLDYIEEKKIYDIDYDIFTSSIDSKFTFVRCMNILNLGYFGSEKIKIAINKLFSSLQQDGILLVGRTINNQYNNASFFKKEGSQLVWLEDIGTGSEIKTLILNAL